MDRVIDVEGLAMRYNDRQVLTDVTFGVAPGETVAVLGPNGAGKTTLVEILEGFRHRTGGRANVLGEDPDKPSRRLRTLVGVVLQETRHDPGLTVAETVDLTRGWYPDPLSTDEVLDLVSLTADRGRRASRLSGGQQRRLDVALALVGRPQVLFLDEPTTGFDPAARREAWDVLRRLRASGTTVVLTTHYLDEAAALADRLLVLDGGRIVADGPPRSIGGRDTTFHISFRPDVVDDLPVSGVLDDGVWRAIANDVAPVLHELSDWGRRHGIGFPELEIGHPSLEDTYLGLIA